MTEQTTVGDVQDTREPGYRVAYNVNPRMYAINLVDDNGNPTGGQVSLIKPPLKPFLQITWQNGPRGNANGTLDEPNGAFIEDVLWAALQRLEFFNDTKYRDRGNSIAITHIEQALQALNDRSLERAHRGVEGKREMTDDERQVELVHDANDVIEARHKEVAVPDESEEDDDTEDFGEGDLPADTDEEKAKDEADDGWGELEDDDDESTN